MSTPKETENEGQDLREAPTTPPEQSAETLAPATNIAVSLATILDGRIKTDDIFEAKKATQLGIEARGIGKYDLARKLYQRSLEIDSPVDFIAGSANMCDLDRIESNLEKAHDTVNRGIEMAQHIATEYGLSLEKGP